MEKLRLSLSNNGDGENEEIFNEGDYVESSEDEGDGGHKHNQLLDAVRLLDGKNNRSCSVQRTEATTTVSEFDLGTCKEDKLKVGDLLNSLGKTVIQAKLKKKVTKIEKDDNVLPAPLQKLESAKVKRIVAYKDVCSSISKWDKVVHQNREADQLTFPLKQTMLTMEPIQKVVKRCTISTPLEMEIAELLQNREPEIKNVIGSQEVNSKKYSLEEAMAMRQEMSRMRALQTYQEAKFRRKSKIKSKRYHRILKKEKLKKEMKEFEELQKTNPELAAEKFLEMDNQRILERMTLRHRNTGKWAKYQLLRSKHDKESGRIIQEQIELNRTLTAKKFVSSDSEDEAAIKLSEPQAISGEEEQNTFFKMPQTDSSNPWMSNKKAVVNEPQSNPEPQDEEETSDVNYRKYWTEENKKKKTKKVCFKESDKEAQNNAENENKAVELATDGTEVKKIESKKCLSSYATREMDEVDEIFSHATDSKRTRNEVVDKEPKLRKRKRKEKSADLPKPNKRKEMQIEETLVRKTTLKDFDNLPIKESSEDTPASIQQTTSENITGKAQDNNMVIDPNDFITVKQRVIKCKAPNMENYDDDDIDDATDREHHMTIVEAFADDDVIEEFKMEKQAIIDRDTPKDVDLTLPGWGTWGGSGIQNSNRTKRLILKAPPAPFRKDSKIGNVILSELSEENLRPHLVTKIPFPYTNADEYEKSVQAPIGKQWNPETAFQRVIAPKIVSKMGTIIEPMDADAIKGESSRQISYL